MEDEKKQAIMDEINAIAAELEAGEAQEAEQTEASPAEMINDWCEAAPEGERLALVIVGGKGIPSCALLSGSVESLSNTLAQAMANPGDGAYVRAIVNVAVAKYKAFAEL